MPVITVFSGAYCDEDRVLQALIRRTGYKCVSDAELVKAAGRVSSMPESTINRAFSVNASVFNKFSLERERSIACLRLVLARMLKDDNQVFTGFSGQLIPRDISHVLRVCLIADMKSRMAASVASLQASEPDAVRLIHARDEDRAAWTRRLFNQRDPWRASLYDMVFPTDKMTAEVIVDTIAKTAHKPVVHPTRGSQKAVQDFLLAARVEVALLWEGHSVLVRANDGAVSLTINRQVLMLKQLEGELTAIAAGVTGVHSVKTRVDPGFHNVDIYPKQDIIMPSKILLVDDEREFVQTLSERLLMRDMDSSVAYDGESALKVVHEDEPDVMILDLKMPGIDGIEVLRRVKSTQPQVEVIILTGHGSEADENVCMQLGAFAYLQKPVDVEELSATIKRANKTIREKMMQSGNGLVP